MEIISIFIILLLLQIKHFICDYPLQNAYMLNKMKEKGWVLPLLSHSIVHGVGTFIVFVLYDFKIACILAILDVILHFIVDRIKASPKLLNRWGIDKSMFWNMLGLDQMMHHIINILFVYVLYIMI